MNAHVEIDPRASSLLASRNALLRALAEVGAELGQLQHGLAPSAQSRARALSLRIHEARNAADAAFEQAIEERVSETRLPEVSPAEADEALRRAMGSADHAMETALERMLQALGRSPEVLAAAYGIKIAARAMRRAAPETFAAMQAQERRQAEIRRRMEAERIGEFHLVRAEGEAYERPTLGEALEIAEDYEGAQVLRICGHVVEDVTEEARRLALEAYEDLREASDFVRAGSEWSDLTDAARHGYAAE